jgi:hypothetical protein
LEKNIKKSKIRDVALEKTEKAVPLKKKTENKKKNGKPYGRDKISRVSQASPNAKNRALGKANLPRVLHSGKNSTRGREALSSAAECLALGKERHSAKALFPKCNTRGRAALGKESYYLTA